MQLGLSLNKPGKGCVMKNKEGGVPHQGFNILANTKVFAKILFSNFSFIMSVLLRYFPHMGKNAMNLKRPYTCHKF